MGWIWIGFAAVSHLVGSGATLLDKELLKKISPRVFFVISEVMWLPLLLFPLFFDAWNARVASRMGTWALLYYPASFEQWMVALRPGWCGSLSLLLMYYAVGWGAPSRVIMAIGIAKPIMVVSASFFFLGRIFSGAELLALFFLITAAWFAGFSLVFQSASGVETKSRASLFLALGAGAGFGLYAFWFNQSPFSFLMAVYWQCVGQLCIMALVSFFSIKAVWAWLREQTVELSLHRTTKHAPQERVPFSRFIRLYVVNKVLGLASVFMLSIAIKNGDAVYVSSLDGVKYLASFFQEYRVGVKRTLGWKWAVGAGVFLCIGLLVLALTGKGVS
ncbi:MAG: hypothetical protein Q7R73_02590 [bacterium]|nr:hypothetical protein [bacterium]